VQGRFLRGEFPHSSRLLELVMPPDRSASARPPRRAHGPARSEPFLPGTCQSPASPSRPRSSGGSAAAVASAPLEGKQRRVPLAASTIWTPFADPASPCFRTPGNLRRLCQVHLFQTLRGHMSHPTGPEGPASPAGPSGIIREIRRRGRAFGLDYDVGIRIITLSDPEMEIARPPLLLGAPRLALTGGTRSEASAPEGVAVWEWEGGALP
jgi:hypothetical protein